MQSLFPVSQGNARGRRADAALLSVKAGKCELEPMSNDSNRYRVTADIRKGEISIVKGNDNLRHFRWGDRSGNIVDDLIIFPDEALFSKVNTGRDSDRVFVLKFNSGSRRFMFWMQDRAAAEKDAEIVATVNQLLNNPSADVASDPGATASGMAPDAWMQMLGLPNATPSTAAAATPSAFSELDLSSLLGAAPPANNVNVDTLASILNASRLNSQRQAEPRPDLADVLNAEAIIDSGILSEPSVREELLQQLPEGQQTSSAIEDNIRSPQFRQALNSLGEALQGDSYNSVLANLGLNPEPGSAKLGDGDPIGAFLDSVEAAHPVTGAATTVSATSGDAMEVTESVPTNKEANEEDKMDE